MVTISPYGTWTSPIDASGAATLRRPLWVELHGGQVWFAESRPDEGGRAVLLRSTDDGDLREVLPAPWNVRNRVHEYGGRPWTVLRSGGGDRLVFTHWDDQRVYLLDGADPDAVPLPISPPPARPHGYRYADLLAGVSEDEVWCVREVVTGDAPTDVRRDLVALPLSGAAATDPHAVRELAASHHFLTGAKPSPDGRHAAWIGWDHPAMPWDGTQLCVADIDSNGRLGPHRVLAGNAGEAVCQVEWADAESLLALTDPDGWWNLHRVGLDGSVRNLAPCTEELGGPLWGLGSRWFAPLGQRRHAVLRSGRLAVLDEHAGTVTDVDVPLPAWHPVLCASGDVVAGIAAGPDRPASVFRLDLAAHELTELTTAPRHLPDPAYLPQPVPRVFGGPDGRDIPAYVYPPRNPDFAAPEDELPPYLVHVHGGPTDQVSGVFEKEFAFFTSRGVGVVAVNYGGSTGYGRTFRERLREQWGVVDVADCAAVAQALAEEGTADVGRLAIRGGSAGGWTAAASLTSVHTYRCGVCRYPVLDLAAFAHGQTHDFESRYLDTLVGSLPQARERYRARSPINRVHELAGPILLLQGLEDQVCPPEQSERFVAALAGSGIPHAYLAFEGEQHGFRRARNIQTALEAELSFYGQILGFTPPDIPTLPLRD